MAEDAGYTVLDLAATANQRCSSRSYDRWKFQAKLSSCTDISHGNSATSTHC